MCSYNRLNGTFACGNKDSLTKILRDEIGFKGFVTSDWGAVHAVSFINSGLDMEMPGEPTPGAAWNIPSFFDAQPVPPPPPAHAAPAIDDMMDMFGGTHSRGARASTRRHGRLRRQARPEENARCLKDNTVNEAAITRAAGRVLYEIAHFGYLDGQSKHEVTEQSIEANAKIH